MPSYVDFKELPSTTGSVDANFQRTYTRTFLIQVDDPTATVFFVGSHTSLPTVLVSTMPGDSKAFCVGLVPTRDEEDPYLWRVTATYAYSVDGGYTLAGGAPGSTSGGATGNPAKDSQQKGYAPASRVQAPLSRPADYSYSFVKVKTVVVDEEPYTTSGTGTPQKIRNAAGDPFAEQPTRRTFAKKIVVGLNSNTVPDDVWQARLDTVNSNTVVLDGVTYDPRTLLMDDANSTKVYEDGISYYRWTLVFLYMAHWRVNLRNSGNRAWFELKNATTGAGTGNWAIQTPQDPKIAIPMDLTADGKYLEPTSNPVTGTLVWNPNYLEFNVYPETSWPTPL